MCEIHQQIVHIYFLLQTHTQRGKSPFCKNEIRTTKGNCFSEMQLSPLLFFSLSKFHGLLLTSNFLIAPTPIHKNTPKPTNESYLYL